MRFDFPVTVIAGENGSGKSRVLKAAAVHARTDDPARTFTSAAVTGGLEPGADVIPASGAESGSREMALGVLETIGSRRHVD